MPFLYSAPICRFTYLLSVITPTSYLDSLNVVFTVTLTSYGTIALAFWANAAILLTPVIAGLPDIAFFQDCISKSYLSLKTIFNVQTPVFLFFEPETVYFTRLYANFKSNVLQRVVLPLTNL